MSQYLRLILISLAFIAFPHITHGAELEFDQNKWEINPGIVASTEKTIVRNDFDLKQVANYFLTGKMQTQTATILNPEATKQIETITTEINQSNQSAKLAIKDNWATEFQPHQDGISVDVYSLVKQLSANVSKIQLPVVVSTPTVKLAELNNLGINELVAVGESDFTGSPRNRTVNIKVGAAKFNGLIIAPGEEFSFNKFLGDVDEKNGFLPELVIKRSGVVPELGGGLCQVSSTAFRAAMNAGLPITERRNHSFAVKYYAPQGSDATIYPGVTDLRFVNDLSSHILIQTRIEGTKLYYDFYGTKDDRKVAFDGPTQYDQQSNGAMKAKWTKKVTKNGETKEQVFYSNYAPPALFQAESTVQTNITNPDSQGTPPKPQPPIGATAGTETQPGAPVPNQN